MLKLLQWNCRGYSNKSAEISKIMNDYHIICLQETWLNPRCTTAFKNFCIFRNDRPPPRSGGGTMVLCRKGLNPIPYNTHEICLAGFDLTMISIDE